MPAEQDENTTKLNKTQVVERITLRAHDEPTKVAQPSEQSFDLPSAFVAPQRSAVLGLGTFPVAPMWGNHLDAQLSQLEVQRVSIVGAITNQTSGEVRDEARVESGSDETTLVRRR